MQPQRKPFFNLKTARFFDPGWDKVRFFGSVALFILYIKAMELAGFLAASIVFVFLYSVLYYGVEKLRQSRPLRRKTLVQRRFQGNSRVPCHISGLFDRRLVSFRPGSR